MTPVSVKEAPQKEEDNKNKKKGLLAKLLSLVGRGGGAASAAASTSAAAGVGAASTGLGVAQVAAAGATAGGGWLTYLTTTKGLAAVLGGGAALVSVGMLGSQMFGGPALKGMGGQGFSSQQRAGRNVDQADQPASHLMAFNEGIKAQGEGDDSGGGSDKQATKAGVSDAQPGSPMAAAPHRPATDAYGNPLSAMKSGFGDSNSFGGGAGGGGGGGGSKAGASGVGGPNGLQLTGEAAHGRSGAMNQHATNVTASARTGRSVTGAGGGLNQLKAASALSLAGSKTANYQTAGYTATRAFHGTTGGSTINSAIGQGGGIQGGAGLTGEAANLAGNPNTVAKSVTPPAAPAQGPPNKSCSDGKPAEPDAGSAGMDATAYATLTTDCKNQKQLVTNLLWLIGFAAAALIGVGMASRATASEGKWGGFVAAGILTVLVAGMLTGIPSGLFGDGLIKILQESPSLMMFAVLELAGCVAVTAYAWYAAATGNTIFSKGDLGDAAKNLNAGGTGTGTGGATTGAAANPSAVTGSNGSLNPNAQTAFNASGDPASGDLPKGYSYENNSTPSDYTVQNPDGTYTRVVDQGGDAGYHVYQSSPGGMSGGSYTGVDNSGAVLPKSGGSFSGDVDNIGSVTPGATAASSAGSSVAGTGGGSGGGGGAAASSGSGTTTVNKSSMDNPDGTTTDTVTSTGPDGKVTKTVTTAPTAEKPGIGSQIQGAVVQAGVGAGINAAVSGATGGANGANNANANSNGAQAQHAAPAPSGGGSGGGAAAPAAAPADAAPASAPATGGGGGGGAPAPAQTNAGTGIDASDEMAQLFGGGSGSGTTTV